MTTNADLYGWTAPGLNDQPNGPAQIGALRENVATTLLSAKVGAPGGDTNGVQSSGLVISAGAGFGSLSYEWEIRNGWTFLFIQVTRTGATITAPANGNIGNTLMVTLGSHQPPAQIPTLAYLVTTGVGGAAVLYPSGEIYLLSINSSGTVSTGDVIRCYFGAYPA